MLNRSYRLVIVWVMGFIIGWGLHTYLTPDIIPSQSAVPFISTPEVGQPGFVPPPDPLPMPHESKH